MGPPIVPPNWLFFLGEIFTPFWLLKKLFELSAEFCRNSNRLPWNSLVPDLVTTFMTVFPPKPTSAVYVFCCTLNSCTASTDGVYSAVVTPLLFSLFVWLTPSRTMSAVEFLPPLEMKLVAPAFSPNDPPAACVTPGESCARLKTDRLV